MKNVFKVSGIVVAEGARFFKLIITLHYSTNSL